MKIRKTLFSLIIGGLAVAATILITGHTAARPTAVELIGIGAVTLTPNQGLRVNLVNAIENATVRLTVKFIDKSGQVLKAEELSLGYGSTSDAAVFVPTDLPAAANIQSGPRTVHVIVESVPDTPEAPAPFVMPSLEVFDRKAGKVESFYASFLQRSTGNSGGR
jgi:hypothetical protein